MKTITTIILITFSLFYVSCSGGNANSRPKTAEELRAELKAQEELSPTTYITDGNVTLTKQEKQVRKGGLFRDPEYAPDGAMIEGDFISSATVAKFKDIQVKVFFYSQTKTLIEEKSYVLYQYIKPNSTLHFSMKIDVLPQAYKEFGFDVIGATPVE